jgi:hypothetical protein
MIHHQLKQFTKHLLKFCMEIIIIWHKTRSVYTNQNKVNSDNNIDVNIMRCYWQYIQKSNYKSDNSDGTYNLAFKHLTKKEGETLDWEENT